MEDKYSPVDEENVSEVSEKSKLAQVTSEKKLSESKKNQDSLSSNLLPLVLKSQSKEERDSDHEDPHNKCKLKIYYYLRYNLNNSYFSELLKLLKLNG